MIGNDIVDLKKISIESDWRRKGWLNKICTPLERDLIISSDSPDILVWKFWTMKESVYKAHQRRYQLKPIFNPSYFECKMDGLVIVKDDVYKTKSYISDDYIFSEVIMDNSDIENQLYNSYSEMEFGLKATISQWYRKPISSIRIKKDKNRIPTLTIFDTDINSNFSITHHGKYYAYSIQLPTKDEAVTLA